MVIQKIEIQNFRIFYREHSIELSDGLNLIVGANGSGKTTIFDALEWLFRTDGTNKMATNFISKKRIGELSANDSDDVRVAMTYEHKGKIKILEKMFHFTKSFDGEVSTSNYSFSLIEQNGVERIIKDGILFDKDITFDMRKFIMFKGETDLDVLANSNALKLLVDSYSDVKDFDAFFSFMEYATKTAEKAHDHALMKESKNVDKIKSLKKVIEQTQRNLSDVDKEINIKENEAVNFDGLLRNIEQDNEPSRLLVAVNRRIENLSQKRSEIAARIRENYSRDLLEKMWILMGFEEIANEYSYKTFSADRKRRRIELECLGAKKNQNPFKYNYIPDLLKLDVRLDENLPNLLKIKNEIQEAIAFNEKLHDDIKKIDANLIMDYEQKKRILAQTDGLSEEQLLANYENISEWMDKKRRAENRIEALKRQRVQLTGDLEEAQIRLNKISEGTEAAKYAKIALIVHHISDAFKSAKEENKRRLLTVIEDKANENLSRLLPDDFIGTVRILEKANGQAEVVLLDCDNCRIYNPGSSLVKAYSLAVMLAIWNVNYERHFDAYPLIMDASITCFGNRYVNPLLLNDGRQMIIITSDFVKNDTGNGNMLDSEALSRIHGRVFYLQKKQPSDNKRLSSQHTTISLVKQ